jgi:predicted ribosome-associated RNA-binding protein Tma20
LLRFLHSRYSDLTESELDSLFPKNIQTVTQKLSNGVNIFSRADQSAEPVLFELVENNNNGNAKNAGKSPIKRSLVPTVHSAWRCPQMLPAVIVRNPVVEFICRAANVMLPGTLRESPAFIGPKVCKKGALVFVLAQGIVFCSHQH